MMYIQTLILIASFLPLVELFVALPIATPSKSARIGGFCSLVGFRTMASRSDSETKHMKDCSQYKRMVKMHLSAAFRYSLR